MTVSPARIAQIVAPSARCSVWVHSAIWVSTWAPPITTWTANRVAAPTDSRTSVGRSRCVRQAASATATTIKPTTAATQRCRTWGPVTSVSGGTSVPPINGQSGKTRAESVAVTCEPNSRRANVAAAAKAATSVNRWLVPCLGRSAG